MVDDTVYFGPCDDCGTTHGGWEPCPGGWVRTKECGNCKTRWTASSVLPCPVCGGKGKWVHDVAESMPPDQTIVVLPQADAGHG